MGEVSTGTYVPPTQVRMQTASSAPQPPEHHAPTNPSIEERAAARTSFDTPAQPASPLSQMISDADRALRRTHTSLSADNGNLRELNRQKQDSGWIDWAFGTSAAIDKEIRMTEEQRVLNETTATRLGIFNEGLKSAEGLLSKEELSQQDRLELARIIVEQEDLKGKITGVSRGNSQQRITELAQQDSQTLIGRFEEVAVYNAQALNIGNSQNYREELNNQRQGLRDVRADYDAAGNRIEIAETGTRIVRDASLVAGTTVAGVAAAPVVVAGATAVGVTGTIGVAGTTVAGVTASGTAAGLTLAAAENVATGLSDAAFNDKSAAQIVEERVDQMKSDATLVFSTAAATGVAVATGGAGNAMLGTRASSGLARVGMGAVSGAAAGETGYVVNTGISYAGAVREFNELTKGQALTAEQSAQAWSEFSAQRGLDAESMAWGALKSAGLGAVGGTIGYGGAAVRGGLDSTAAKAVSFVAEEVLTTGACLAPAAYLYSQGKISGEELVQMGFRDFVTGIVSNVAGETAHAAINGNRARVAAADAVTPVKTPEAQSKPATPQDIPIRTNEPQSAVRTDPSQRPIPAGSTTEVPEGRISNMRGMLKGIAGEVGENMSVETMKQADMDRHLGAEGRDVMNNGRRVIISEERYAQLQARPVDADGADPLTNILAHEAAAIYCQEKGIPANDIPMLVEGIDPNKPASVRDFNDRMARHEGQDTDKSQEGAAQTTEDNKVGKTAQNTGSTNDTDQVERLSIFSNRIANNANRPILQDPEFTRRFKALNDHDIQSRFMDTVESLRHRGDSDYGTHARQLLDILGDNKVTHEQKARLLDLSKHLGVKTKLSRGLSILGKYPELIGPFHSIATLKPGNRSGTLELTIDACEYIRIQTGEPAVLEIMRQIDGIIANGNVRNFRDSINPLLTRLAGKDPKNLNENPRISNLTGARTETEALRNVSDEFVGYEADVYHSVEVDNGTFTEFDIIVHDRDGVDYLYTIEAKTTLRNSSTDQFFDRQSKVLINPGNYTIGQNLGSIFENRNANNCTHRFYTTANDIGNNRSTATKSTPVNVRELAEIVDYRGQISQEIADIPVEIIIL